MTTAYKAYKLMRIRKDGTLGSLFINRRAIIPIGVWLKSKDFKTPGYARRPGWHVAPRPIAPHLSVKGRVWMRVEVMDKVDLIRPAVQGGTWWLAKRMRVVGPLE